MEYLSKCLTPTMISNTNENIFSPFLSSVKIWQHINSFLMSSALPKAEKGLDAICKQLVLETFHIFLAKSYTKITCSAKYSLDHRDELLSKRREFKFFFSTSVTHNHRDTLIKYWTCIITVAVCNEKLEHVKELLVHHSITLEQFQVTEIQHHHPY